MISHTRRFCFLLATTAVLTGFSIGGNEALGQNVAAPDSTVTGNPGSGVVTQNPGLSRDIDRLGSDLHRYFSFMGDHEERASQQGLTMDAKVAAANAANFSAHGQNIREGVGQGVEAGIAANLSNTPDKLCTSASGARSTAVVESGAEEAIDALLEEAMANINMNAGSAAENGLIDYQRNIFQEVAGLCDPQSNGGNAVYCSGSGTSFISLGTLLRAQAIRPSDPMNDHLRTLQQLLYARIPISINPDLLENPNTEVMNTMLEGERLKAEMSVGQSIFSLLHGNRMKIEGASVGDSLRSRMEANGWAEEDIAQYVDGGVSRNALYHALTVGSYGTPFMLQELTGNDTDTGIIIAREMMLNNVLEYHQYRLLEAIALTTATTAVMNRDDAIEDLNRRISALNSRQ